MTDFLDIPIGPPERIAEIETVALKTIELPGRDPQQKVIFTVKDVADHRFEISDAWLPNNSGTVAVRGLWYEPYKRKDGSTSIPSDSNLARLMNHYDARSLKNMIGMEVTLQRDSSNYLVFVGCDFDEE